MAGYWPLSFLLGSLSKDVFEQRTSTGSEVFSFKIPRRYKICILLWRRLARKFGQKQTCPTQRLKYSSEVISLVLLDILNTSVSLGA